MNFLLLGFLKDLSQRIKRIRTELNTLGPISHEVIDYKNSTEATLSNLENKVNDMLQDPNIGNPNFAKNYIHKYKRIAEKIYIIESFPLLVLLRYSEQDRFMTLICRKIAEEINYPYAPPICSTLSPLGYLTHPEMNLIMVPVLEPFHLLGLPDLYHEFGHIIFFREKLRLYNPFLAVVDNHFNQKLEECQRNGKETFIEDLEIIKQLWKASWCKEFASDMIAAYLTGPAYGWQNLRLCTNMAADVFAADPSKYPMHPADDARAEAIGVILERMGLIEDSHKIKKFWEQFVNLIGQQKPQEYGLKYPLALLEELCDLIINGCKELGLNPYESQLSQPSDISLTLLLNESWSNFIENPAHFSKWEEEKIEELRSIVGTKM